MTAAIEPRCRYVFTRKRASPGTAAVTVTDRDGKELFRLTCAWQEAIE